MIFNLVFKQSALPEHSLCVCALLIALDCWSRRLWIVCQLRSTENGTDPQDGRDSAVLCQGQAVFHTRLCGSVPGHVVQWGIVVSKIYFV